MRDRRPLGGYVTEDAHDGWHHFARHHDVDVSALLEAVGRWLAEQDRAPAGWKRHIETARAIAAERRSRRPT